MNNTEKILTRIVSHLEGVGRFRATIIAMIFPEISDILQDLDDLRKEHNL